MEIIEKFGGVFDETYDRFAMQYSFKQKKMVRAIEVVILFSMTYSFIRYLREKMLLLI